MAIREVQQFPCTVPANTAKANPAVFPLVMMPLDIEWLEWQVPSGVNGEVGFWLGSEGQQIIPFASGAANWIVTNDYTAHWDVDRLPADTSWELRAYNLGILPHVITVRFGLSLPLTSAPAGPAFPSLSVLTS